MVTLWLKLQANARLYGAAASQWRVPYLPPRRLHALRDRRVRHMVRYAAATVPYYRDLFAREGWSPRDFRSAADLARLPLIDKRDVIANPERFRSESVRGRHAVMIHTTGSSGERLPIHHDPISLVEDLAFAERARAVITQRLGRRSGYRLAYLAYPQTTAKSVWKHQASWAITPPRPARIFLSVIDPHEQVAEQLERFRPDVLYSYGSYLEVLFRLIAERRLTFTPPPVCVFGGDGMSEESRQWAQQRFGITVLGDYAAVEGFRIGFSCERGSGYHLNEDLCPLRLIGPDGEDVAAGCAGEVVIHNLVNHGTVLLNYRLGDRATANPEPCPCGRTLPRLAGLEGRVEETIYLTDGRILHPAVVWATMRRHQAGVLRYQFVQHEPECFELRLVTASEEGFRELADPIVADLARTLGDAGRVEATWHRELAAQAGGKFRKVMALPHSGGAG